MQVLVLRSKELELVCSKQPCVHGDVPTDPFGVACHSNPQELHRSMARVLVRSKVQALVRVHNMVLELVHSRKELRHIGCEAWHANVPTSQLALVRMLVRRSKLGLVRSKVLELVLRSMLLELDHSNHSCDGTNQPKR